MGVRAVHSRAVPGVPVGSVAFNDVSVLRMAHARALPITELAARCSQRVGKGGRRIIVDAPFAGIPRQIVNSKRADIGAERFDGVDLVRRPRVFQIALPFPQG